MAIGYFGIRLFYQNTFIRLPVYYSQVISQAVAVLRETALRAKAKLGLANWREILP
jgi:hypothetical protein